MFLKSILLIKFLSSFSGSTKLCARGRRKCSCEVGAGRRLCNGTVPSEHRSTHWTINPYLIQNSFVLKHEYTGRPAFSGPFGMHTAAPWHSGHLARRQPLEDDWKNAQGRSARSLQVNIAGRPACKRRTVRHARDGPSGMQVTGQNGPKDNDLTWNAKLSKIRQASQVFQNKILHSIK